MCDLRSGEILPMVKYNNGSVVGAPTFSDKVTGEEQKNRDILMDALIKGGAINFTGEIWHHSVGDGVWAYMTNQSACYRGVEGSDIKNRIVRPVQASEETKRHGMLSKM